MNRGREQMAEFIKDINTQYIKASPYNHPQLLLVLSEKSAERDVEA